MVEELAALGFANIFYFMQIVLGKHLGIFKGRELTVVQATNDTLHVDTLADLAERYKNAPMPPPPPAGKVP